MNVDNERLEQAKGFSKPIKVYDLCGYRRQETNDALKRLIVDFLATDEVRIMLCAHLRRSSRDMGSEVELGQVTHRYAQFVSRAQAYLEGLDGLQLPAPRAAPLDLSE